MIHAQQVEQFCERLRNANDRDEAAAIYVEALDKWGGLRSDSILSPWATINRAIRRKWTLSGLEHIKSLAWKKQGADVRKGWEEAK